MYRIVVTFLLMLFTLVTFGQNSQQRSRQQVISKAYTAALTQVQMAQESAEMDCRMSVNLRRNFPGSGVQDYSIDYYCNPVGTVDSQETDTPMTYNAYFIRVKFNWAVRNTIKEYLVDSKTGKLMFVFCSSDDAPTNIADMTDCKYESRMYFKVDGSFSHGKSQIRHLNDKIESVKTYKTDDAEVLDEVRFFAHLMEVFGQTMNYEQ